MKQNGKPKSKHAIKAIDPSLLPTLPSNWLWVMLCDLATGAPNAITDGPFGSNLKTSHYTDIGPRVIRLQNIGDGVFVDEYAHLSVEHFQSLSRHHINAGDLAIAALGETLPRSCVIPSWVGPALVKADCPRFAPNAAVVLSEYVNYALNSPGTRQRTSQIIHGVGRPRLNLSEIRGIWIPLAPKNEQKRIVTKLAELLSDLDAGVAALERAQANLKLYRAAVLKAAVEGRLTEKWRASHSPLPPGEGQGEGILGLGEGALGQGEGYEPADKLLARILAERRRRWIDDQLTKWREKKSAAGWPAARIAQAEPDEHTKINRKYKEPATPDTANLPDLPRAWCWANVDQVSEFVRYGSSAKASDDRSGTPVLRMGNIQLGTLDFRDLKYLPSDHHEFPDILLEPGDLLFNRTNSAELVGKSAVYFESVGPCSYASYLIAVRTLTGCDSRIPCMVLNSSQGRRWIATVVSQQVGQANVNGTKLRAFIFPLPPSDEQSQIINEVESRLSILEQSERLIEFNLSRAARLRQSILKRAFEGKLVPQDPNDEPADVLLERIRAAREKAAVAARSPGSNNQSRRKRPAKSAK